MYSEPVLMRGSLYHDHAMSGCVPRVHHATEGDDSVPFNSYCNARRASSIT